MLTEAEDGRDHVITARDMTDSRWVEDRRRASTERGIRADDDTVARLADRVSWLDSFALRVVAADHDTDTDTDTDTMSDLLAALRASVEAARPKSARQRPDEEHRGA